MRAYLRHLALAFAVLLLAVAGFTRLIDPSGYWDGPIINGLNRYKPSSAQHVEAVKLRQLARLQPRTIIAGNSRVDVGFDPASAAWPKDMQPVYNLGIPGLRMDGLVDILMLALDESRPRELLLGVDFVDFRVTEVNWRAGQAQPGGQTRMATNELVQQARLLLALNSFTAAVYAIPEQWKAHPGDITAAGFNSLAEYNDIVASEGHAALFEQRLRENVRTYVTGPKQVSWPVAGRGVEWEALARLAAACRERGIRLTLFTYPHHAQQLLMFRQAGLWPAFGDFQRRLAAFGAREQVPVWRFTVITPETTEPIPVPGDTRARMRYYWEAGHFKAALGDQIVQRLSGTGTMGERLAPATVDAQLASLAASLDGFARTHPAILADIERAAAAAHGPRGD